MVAMKDFSEPRVCRDNTSIDHHIPVVLISDETCLFFKLIFICGLVLPVSFLGAVTNVINIICYIKQGLNDSVNVNFLVLAITDFGSLVTVTFGCPGYIPSLQDIVQSFDVVEMLYLTFGWPHVIFARVTSWITALITLERCVSITMPLKVKSFFTPKQAAITTIFIYIIITGSVAPVFYANGYGWKFSLKRNRTILGLVFTDDREQVENIAYVLNHVALPFSAFVSVIVCTITLVISLRKQAAWRKQSTGMYQAYNINSRDQRLGKTIVIIAAVFIVSYIPMCVIFVVMIFVPGMSFDGYNKNVLIICGGISVLPEVMNSSVNIFIYYKMSSRYRHVFNQFFKCLW